MGPKVFLIQIGDAPGGARVTRPCSGCCTPHKLDICVASSRAVGELRISCGITEVISLTRLSLVITRTRFFARILCGDLIQESLANVLPKDAGAEYFTTTRRSTSSRPLQQRALSLSCSVRILFRILYTRNFGNDISLEASARLFSQRFLTKIGPLRGLLEEMPDCDSG